MAYNEKSRKNLERGRNLTTERARKMQMKSAEQRKSNRIARELLVDALAEQDRKWKGMQRLAEQYAQGDLQAIKLAQEILGENKVDLSQITRPVVVSVQDQETADCLQKILNGETD